MTNKLLIYGFLAIVAMLPGCDDYLKEDSGDLLIPKKVDEYSPMLYAEGYPSTFTNDVAWFKLMTDDVEMSHLEIDSTSKNLDAKNGDAFDLLSGGDGRQAYIWSEDIELKLSDNFWKNRYSNILACNTVIDALPVMEIEGDSAKYNYLAAQAYGLRAYHYWALVNTYALPYSQANLDKPGVILRTEPQVDIKARPRSSIRQIYKQINEDIQKAEQYMQKSYVPGNKHLLTEPAILLLASRIALFQENWDEVIRVGELFLKENSLVFDLNTVDTTLLGAYSDIDAFYIMDGKINDEIVFTFGGSSTSYDYLADEISGSWYGLGFRPSRSGGSSLLESYEGGDLRRQAWFIKDVPAKKATSWWDEDQPRKYCYDYPSKYRRKYNGNAEKPSEKTYRENWRSVEVMLNVAEAYVRKTNSVDQRTLDLLNTLRYGRIDHEVYVEKKGADFSNSEDLLKFIHAERRREFCFEEAMRFWDLRRQGMPRIEHRWYHSWNSYETYGLGQGSPNYVLGIPDAEVNYNEACMDNVRETITAK